LKNLLIPFCIILLISCQQLSKNVEVSFRKQHRELESKIEMEYEANSILADDIAKQQDTAKMKLVQQSFFGYLTYYRLLDKLVKQCDSLNDEKLDKRALKSNYILSSLQFTVQMKTAAKSVPVERKIDSLYAKQKDMLVLPNYAIKTELLIAKVHAGQSFRYVLESIK